MATDTDTFAHTDHYSPYTITPFLPVADTHRKHPVGLHTRFVTIGGRAFSAVNSSGNATGELDFLVGSVLQLAIDNYGKHAKLTF